MRFTFQRPSGPNTQYGAGAFDAAVGQRVPVLLEAGGEPAGHITVVAAEVVDGGRVVEFTVDADEPALR